jgi:hypothetical protein
MVLYSYNFKGFTPTEGSLGKNTSNCSCGSSLFWTTNVNWSRLRIFLWVNILTLEGVCWFTRLHQKVRMLPWMFPIPYRVLFEKLKIPANLLWVHNMRKIYTSYSVVYYLMDSTISSPQSSGLTFVGVHFAIVEIKEENSAWELILLL